jgi:uncharacterized protein involved in exopolysaccharide biosynthesis/Mrp family chromosome partitioning ATPase
MNAKSNRPHAPLLTLGDIYYILFRHKWKILILSAIGLSAALVLPRLWPQVYESEAKLLIKYVTETRALSGPNGGGERVMIPDANGRNIINTELQILTSMDLDLEVATNVGTVQILGKEGNVLAAAAVISAGLQVEAPPNSDVISVTFKHKDPTVVQLVLKQAIETYLRRHATIRHPGGTEEFLTKETDHLRTSLADTEAQLRAIKTNLGIVSFDDSRKNFGDQITTIEQNILDAQTDLAGHQAAYEELTKRANEIEQHSTNAAKPVNVGPVPSETLAEYKTVSDKLKGFKAKEQELLGTYLPENSLVKDMHQQVVTTEKQKKQLEEANPGLISAVIEDTKSGNAGPSLQERFVEESTQIATLQKRIEALTNHLAFIRGRAVALDAKEAEITELERTRKLQESHYEYYRERLENQSVDESVGAKASNIMTIQSPSAPYLNNSKMSKVRAGLAVMGVLIGLGLAFLIELYIDHSLKRPADIESRLGVPLFLSIPYRNGNKKPRLLKEPPKTVIVLRSEALDCSVVLNGSKVTIGREEASTVTLEDGSVSQHHCEIFSRNGEVIVKDLGSDKGTFVDGERIMEATLKPDQTLRVGNVEFRIEKQEPVKDLAVAKSTAVTPPWDPRHALRPFYDTLRDRLITYFEVKNLTHNPKLVALTSCGGHAGVSSTAAGLAAALSETGEGNVLLVDMNVERGAAHHFYKGHLSCGIDEALKKEKRHEARVQDNLYVVTESSSDEDSLPRVLPKRFVSLVPKLKASDYDYIIFDMPPMSQISITPRLARYMDMVMVVVESEKTDRDVVQRAVNMLTETKANVGVVLNKRKNYVPKRIQQEL